MREVTVNSKAETKIVYRILMGILLEEAGP
jgi:hypothetical protein